MMLPVRTSLWTSEWVAGGSGWLRDSQRRPSSKAGAGCSSSSICSVSSSRLWALGATSSGRRVPSGQRSAGTEWMAAKPRPSWRAMRVPEGVVRGDQAQDVAGEGLAEDPLGDEERLAEPRRVQAHLVDVGHGRPRRLRQGERTGLGLDAGGDDAGRRVDRDDQVVAGGAARVLGVVRREQDVAPPGADRRLLQVDRRRPAGPRSRQVRRERAADHLEVAQLEGHRLSAPRGPPARPVTGRLRRRCRPTSSADPADFVGHVVAVVAGLADGQLVPGGVEEHVPAAQLEGVVALARPEAAGQLGVQLRQFPRRVVVTSAVLCGAVEQVGQRPPLPTGGGAGRARPRAAASG